MVRVLLRLMILLTVTVSVVVVGQRYLFGDDGAERVEVTPTTPVRVASTDLGVGIFLDEVEAPFEDWPDAELQEGWITPQVAETGDILGAVVIRPIPAGEPITRDDLLMPGQDGFLAAVLSPGMRAVSVAVDAVSGNAGHVFPGDQVDVILTQRLASDARRGTDWVSETILESVRVIAVDQNLEEDLNAREKAKVPRTFTLEVTPSDVERIAVASELGRISFSLRSLLVEQENDAPSPARDRATYAMEVSRALRPVETGEEPAPQAVPEPRGVRIFRGSAVEGGDR